MMGFLIGSLYSVKPNPNIEWYIYIVEPEYETEIGKHIHEHFTKISHKLGTEAAIVLGHTTLDFSNEGSASGLRICEKRCAATIFLRFEEHPDADRVYAEAVRF
jgi:hypothetical protein